MTSVESILSWISAHPQWAGAMVLAVAFFESLAIIGLFVPGWLLLVGVGAIIGAGSLDFYAMALASFIGAFAGESLSYFVGRYNRHRVPDWKWFQKHPQWLNKSHVFFKKHGASSVAFGRFFGPVRAFVPLVAGISEMPPLRFMIINLLSALVWAPAYLLPGVIAGAAIEVDTKIGAAILVSLLGLLIFSWLAVKELRQFFKNNKNKSEQTSTSVVSIPLPLLKAIISLCIFAIIFKLLFFGGLQPDLEALFERVVTVISR